MRMPRIRFPNGITRDYYLDLRDLIQKMHLETENFITATVIPRLNMLKDSLGAREFYRVAHRAERIAAREDAAGFIALRVILQDTARQYWADDWIDEIAQALDALEGKARDLFITTTAQKLADDFIGKVKTHGMIEVGRQVKAVLGFDPMVRSPKIEETAKAAIRENVSLIKSIPVKYHQQIENVVLTGVRSGRSGKQLTEDILNIYNVTEERAKLIAVDQAGKMLGDVTRIRHTDLGLESFRWRDSGDNRVREKHREFNGKVYTWDKGAPGGIFPGQEVRCRCTAEVVEDELTEVYKPEIAPLSQTTKTNWVNSQKKKKKPAPQPQGQPSPVPIPAQVVAQVIKPVIPETGPIGYERAKTMEEAEGVAMRSEVALLVDYRGIKEVDTANRINKALIDLRNKYGASRLNEIGTRIKPPGKAWASANKWTLRMQKAFFNNPSEQFKQSVTNFVEIHQNRLKYFQDLLEPEQYNKLDLRQRRWVQNGIRSLEKSLKFSRYNVLFEGKEIESVLTHEFGHVLSDQAIGMINGVTNRPLYSDWQFIYHKMVVDGDIYKVSEYAYTDAAECFAECFTLYNFDPAALPPYVREGMENILNVLKLKGGL